MNSKIAHDVTRAAIAAAEAEEAYVRHRQEAEEAKMSVNSMVRSLKDNTIEARDRAVNYARADDDGRMVRQCTESAIQACRECHAAVTTVRITLADMQGKTPEE